MRSLKEILVERYGSKADERMEELQDMLMEYIENGDIFSAEDLLADEEGLEPDYLMDLMP